MKPTHEFKARCFGIEVSGKGWGIFVALAALLAVLGALVLVR